MNSASDAASVGDEASLVRFDDARALVRPLGALVGLTIIAKLLGFAEKQLLAYYFGVGKAVDAFLVASSIGMTLWLLVRELAEPIFVPAFVRAMDEKERARAWGIFLFFVGIAVVIWMTFGAASVLWPAGVIRLLAPGLDQEAASLASKLSAVSAVAGLFLGLSALTYMTLNAQHRFIAPAAGDVAQKGMMLVGCVVAGTVGAGASALAWAFLAGAILRLAVHAHSLRRDLAHLLSWHFPAPSRMRQLGGLAAPVAIGVVLAQLSDLGENYFLSLCESGSIAATAYVRKIADLPILLVPYALAIVLYPHLSRLAARRDLHAFTNVVGTSARGLTLVMLPIAVAMYLLADSIVAVIFQHGAFSAGARGLCAAILRVYSVGLLAFTLEALLVPSFFALQDTRTPIMFGALAVVLNLATAAALVDPYGATGIAMALVFAKTVKLIALGAITVSRSPRADWRGLFRSSLRLGTAALSSIASGVALLTIWPAAEVHSSPVRLLHLLAAALCILASFLSVCCLFASERTLVRAALRLVKRG